MEFEKLQEIIAKVLRRDKDSITPDTKFVDDLGADSLDVLSIVLEIEDTFEISIDDSEVEKISTVGDVVEAIKNKK